MANTIGLSDVSSKDTGKGKELKTGNLKRSYNMPKSCVERKMKAGMKRPAAVKACYSDPRFARTRKQYKAGKGGGIQNLKPQAREQVGKISGMMKKAGIPKALKKRKTKKKGY